MGVAKSAVARWDVQFRTPGSADPLFEQVFALGESQSKFLGMLTPEAWREYADKQNILAAVAVSDQAADTSPVLWGYAAFRLPRDEVVLAHLVVHPSAQGHGVARQLVEELSRRFSNRRGIAARILWYASKPAHMVIGCSDLLEVIDDHPDVLYKRFRRLGIYDREQVHRAGNGRSTVRALHVINTEVFRQPVPLSRLRALAATNCQPLRLVSASRINQGLFAGIMREGRCG